MIRHFLILMVFLSVINHCLAQVINDTVYEQRRPLPQYKKNGDEIILKDNETGTRFILDSARIYITAINSRGIQLWHVDPYFSITSEEYLFKRPIIVSFAFVRSKLSKNKKVIWVIYNNKSAGYVDRENGHYTFLGQN